MDKPFRVRMTALLLIVFAAASGSGCFWRAGGSDRGHDRDHDGHDDHGDHGHDQHVDHH
jgi:hypothetical protein